MSFASQATQQKFPFTYDAVFDGLVEAIQRAGMNVNSQDKVIGRITASAGMSLFSFGENLTFIVEKLEECSTNVSIESSLKLGANISGAHRHQKNFDEIISILSRLLQKNMNKQLSEKKCPFCAEIINNDAIICRYCGKDLPAIVSVNEEIKPNIAANVIAYTCLVSVIGMFLYIFYRIFVK